jgi:hypothetical protein
MTPEVHAMKKTTRTSLTGKALSEKIGQLEMSAPDGNFVFLFCGLKTLAFSLQPLAFVSRVSDQLPSPI